MRGKSGFTLVEILIVVVILGILAAIVIPQFSEASSEAKLSALVSDLQTMRSQIELYKIQHTDQLPGSGSGMTAATFVQAMTGYTDVLGNVAAGPGAGVYGPYLQKIPTNQFNNLDTVEVEAGSAGIGGGNCGWHFNSTPGYGTFYADTAGHTSL